MATYRGAEFVAEQIQSILSQLGGNDELLVVDDASPDNTLEVIRSFDDLRIRVFEAPKNQGYVKSFEQAVMASRGQYIFLADQDDVWVEGRLEVMLEAMATANVVASNFAVLGGGSRGAVPLLRARDSHRHFRNLVGIMVGYRPYYGCTMAMTRDQAQIFAPVPPYLNESHDLWLAICGNIGRSIEHLDAPTLLRRLHESNLTPRGWRPLPTILRARFMLLRCIIEASLRTARYRRHLARSRS